MAAVVGSLVMAVPAMASAADIGFKGPNTSGSGSNPTAEKPESKLWFNDGIWWASMWDKNSPAGFEIFRLDTATQTWSTTNVAIDSRTNTHADTLWDGTHLYVASHKFTTSAGAGGPSYLFRYSYDASTDTYSLDAGFPATINSVDTEALVIDKDSLGNLWATWAEGNKAWVNHTSGSDTSWGASFVLPTTGASNLKTDDMSSLIAFNGSIGVMYSNQNDGTMHFAIHADGAADSAWTHENAYGPGSGFADDHMNLKTYGGKVYVAAKTSRTGSNPLINLLVRGTTGTWSAHVFGTGTENHTRPIVLIDTTAGVIHFFATGHTAGATSYDAIFEKTSPLSSISFSSGQGTTFIDPDGTDPKINNATSTKQNLTSDMGLVVVGSGGSNYWHNTELLAPDGTPPSLTAATVNGATLTLSYSEALDTGSVPATSDFTPKVDGVARGVSTVNVAGSTATLTLTSPVVSTDTVTIDYTPGTNKIRDLAQNNAAALAGQAVTNNTPPPGGSGPIALAGPAISASILSGSTVTLPSWTPGANDLILVSVAQRDESKAISVSGNGLTFTEIANVDNVQGQGGISLWRAQGGAPTAGQITVTISGNTLPVVVEAQRFSGVDTGTPVEATSTNQGPGVDDRNMLQAVTTATSGAWAVGVGWNRSKTLTLPSGDTPILINQSVSSGGDATRSAMWYEGPVASPASTQLGGANDLSAVDDWAMIAVALRPGGGGGGDVTPPVLSSAAVNGSSLTLTYNETLDSGSVPAGTNFTPKVGGVARGVTNVAIAGAVVTLTLASPVVSTDTVTVDYTPGTNKIRDVAQNNAAALTGQAVTNNTPPPGGGTISLAGSAISAAISTGATVTLPSWTPGANELILLSVAQRDESKAISVSGNGLTWTEIANVDNVQGQGGISLWRAQGASPATGQITVTITGNTLPVAVTAQRFGGVATASAVEAQATNPGPGVDDRNMLQAVTTITPGAWAVAVGWHRTAIRGVPAGETGIAINQLAGTGGDATRLSMWYQGPVTSPAATQLGDVNDLSTANDWSMIVVSLKPSP